MTIHVLAVGDVVGTAGLDFLSAKLRTLKKLKNITFTVVNGENVAGNGLTPEQADAIFAAGADVITLGNHTFSRSGIGPYLEDCRYMLRPANFTPQSPGRGFGVFDAGVCDICVVNLSGRFGISYNLENPFYQVDRILKEITAPVVLVDFHGEATSEKLAMGYYLDGRVSALWGTHTHVQTSDDTVLPQGTGYITDLGMTGPIHSVLGIKPEQSIALFTDSMPQRHEVADGPCKMECCLFEIDTASGRCISTEALRII